jgi:single-strand DNA-binding protein
MTDLKLPELNCVIIAGHLTKDPVFRQTTAGTPVVNFCIAANRRHRDSSNQLQEEVCYIGVVAWNALADSCTHRLRKGSAVLVEGELQSRSWKAADGSPRSAVEIKARHIQFLDKPVRQEKPESPDIPAHADPVPCSEDDMIPKGESIL